MGKTETDKRAEELQELAGEGCILEPVTLADGTMRLVGYGDGCDLLELADQIHEGKLQLAKAPRPKVVDTEAAEKS